METIIGIDFGTTNSEVAVLRGGQACTLAGADGARILPSVVYIDSGGRRFVGRQARNVALLHPERTVRSVKRELGGQRSYRIDGTVYSAEQIAGLIFAELKGIAQRALEREVRRAVVTVPAYFDDLKRQATKRAAALAGLEVVRLVNEPTAAALAFGVDSGSGGAILVYDLGGGTFDVSVLQARDGVFQVLATRGDARLGGDDFDQLLARLFMERFREETGIDLAPDRLARQKVLQEAERVKIALSEEQSATAEIPFIAAGPRGPCHLVTRVTRQELEALLEAPVERTLRLTRGALQDAGLRPEELERVLLVGGSSRIPLVRRRVTEVLGRSPEEGIDPEEVVARGAAVQAGILAGATRQMVLLDVTPLALGIETAGERMEILVPRNTALPAAARALFTTVSDYQKRADITVLQGERLQAADDIRLGSFQLENLKPDRGGNPDIEVRFEIDVGGIVHVTGQDLSTGSRGEVVLAAAAGLSGGEIAARVTEAQACELEDRYAAAREERR